MNTVICPVDFSKQSESALRFASDLASRAGRKVLIVHVEPHAEGEEPSTEAGAAGVAGVARAPRVQNASDRAARRLHDLTPRADVEFERVLRVGDPASEIVRLAEQSGASQIVMGTHGRPGHHCVLMGGTAEAVVRCAPCPVTVVRNEDVNQGRQ